jgi:membrane protein implicated in regulation of membrane protease activity
MNGFSLDWILFIIGGLLLIAEIMIPGGVVGLLGLNAILTGTLVYFGILESVPAIMLTWLGLSLGSYLIARPTLTRLLGGETSYKPPVEELEAMDQIVEVVETISCESNLGRIRFQGISWQAMCLEGSIPKGASAKIKYRDNLTYIVEQVDQLES